MNAVGRWCGPGPQQWMTAAKNNIKEATGQLGSNHFLSISATRTFLLRRDTMNKQRYIIAQKKQKQLHLCHFPSPFLKSSPALWDYRRALLPICCIYFDYPIFAFAAQCSDYIWFLSSFLGWLSF